MQLDVTYSRSPDNVNTSQLSTTLMVPSFNNSAITPNSVLNYHLTLPGKPTSVILQARPPEYSTF